MMKRAVDDGADLHRHSEIVITTMRTAFLNIAIGIVDAINANILQPDLRHTRAARIATSRNARHEWMPLHSGATSKLKPGSKNVMPLSENGYAHQPQ